MRLHAFLKQSRLSLELSSKDLSIRARLDPSLVTRYEKGERLPTRAHLSQLAESLGLDFKFCLHLWLSEQVEKVFEHEEAETRNEVLSLLLGKQVRAVVGDDRIKQRSLDHLQRFEKCKQLYSEEWLAYRMEQQLKVFGKLCQLVDMHFDSGELQAILIEGKTVARHNLQAHLKLHQLYQAWQQADLYSNKAILDGLAWFQSFYPTLQFSPPKHYKGWAKLKNEEERLNAFLAWHKQLADPPIRLYLDAVFMLSQSWPLLSESYDSQEENLILEELNKRLSRAIEAMESF